jgi:PAS domain S-box-containing protein
MFRQSRLDGMINQENGHIVLAALDEGDSAIIVLRPDADGCTFRIIDINATYSRMTNYTAEEAYGTRLSVLHSPSTDTSMQTKIDEAMRWGRSLRGEIEYLSRVGRSIWLGFTLLPIVDPATHRPHCVLMGRDITDKRQQDTYQAAMQAMLASVFQKIDAPVMIVRSDGFLLLANAAFRALLGYGADEVPRLTANHITAPAYRDILAAAHERQFKDSKPYELDIAMVRGDGSHAPVHLTSVIVQRSDMQPFRIVTIRVAQASATPIAIPPATLAILGCVQYLGLDPIKEVYGPRWSAVGERLWLAAERILKRRLSPDDVYSRTADQGFWIWFKQGTEEENAARVSGSPDR